MVLALTPTPPADSYIPSDQLGESQKVIPLDLYLCANCGNTQLGHVIDGNEVYLNYIYETASTLGLDHHFEVCADTIMKKFQPREGGLVIDIGSNDGCLLKLFKDSGMKILGIDPMPGIAEKATQMGIPTISAFFTQEYAEELKRKYGVASIVTSNNLVADTDDLVSFIRGIRSLMDKNSIFFFETFYLYLQIQNHVWDFTYHEHYSYLSVRPLVRFFRELGMEIIDIEPNETKGGSMRVTLQLEDGTRKVSNSVQLHINKEIEKGLQTKKVFKEYGVDHIRWGTHTRMDEADERAYKMAESGCIYIGFGAESADAYVLELMNKGGFILKNGITKKKINGKTYDFPTTMVNAVENCRKAGIHGNCTWIMAYPGEELKHLQTSVAFIMWQKEFWTKGSIEVIRKTSQTDEGRESIRYGFFPRTALKEFKGVK